MKKEEDETEEESLRVDEGQGRGGRRKGAERLPDNKEKLPWRSS